MTWFSPPNGQESRRAIAPVILLAVAITACGPGQFEGKERFSDGEIADETASETGTESDTTESDTTESDTTETDTETSEDCPELIQNGSVSLDGPDALAAIAGVTKIEGNVEIVGSVGSLIGLECLQEVTGFVYAHDHDLFDFTGLERLQTIGDYLYIGQTFSLGDLAGLEGLRQIGGYLHVNGNASLSSLDGLDELLILDGFLIIAENPELTNIDALVTLAGTYDQVGITANASLTDLDGLGGMIGIGGDLRIVDNPSLVDTSGLAGVGSIAGSVLYQNNPSIGDLGLWSVQTVDGYMVLSALPNLGDLASLSNVYGIDGPLYVFDTGVSDFDGLSSLVWLGGDLWVQGNPNLTNVGGLFGLTEIHGLVRIDENASLVSTAGLGQVQTITAGLSLWGNPNLVEVGLDSLQGVGDFFRIGFTNNLASLGTSQLELVAGDVLVWNNQSLVDMGAFANLQTITGRFYLRENPSLPTLAGLDALTQVFGEVLIIDNDMLWNLDALASLGTALEINLSGNFSLSNLSGLSSLQQLSGDLMIIENEGLSAIAGIDQLAQVGGHLRIESNFNLQAIPGLQGLTTVGGDVRITDNLELPTCAAQVLVGQLVAIGGGVLVSGNLADACGG